MMVHKATRWVDELGMRRIGLAALNNESSTGQCIGDGKRGRLTSAHPPYQGVAFKQHPALGQVGVKAVFLRRRRRCAGAHNASKSPQRHKAEIKSSSTELLYACKSGDSEKCDCHSTRPRPRRLGYVPRIGSPSCAILYTPIGRPSRSSSTSLPRAAAYVSATLSLHSRWATTRLAVSHSRHWSCCATPMNRFINFFSAPRSIRLAATALASGNVLVSPPLPFCDGFGGGEDMFNGSVASTYR